MPEWEKVEVVSWSILTIVTNLRTWAALLYMTVMMKTTKWKEILTPAVSYRRVVVKEEMDHYLFHHHVKHFRQAEGTPGAK